MAFRIRRTLLAVMPLSSPLQSLVTDCFVGSCSLLLSRLDYISHLQPLAGLRQVGQHQSEGNGHRFRVFRLHQLQLRPLHLFQIRHGHQSHHFDPRDLG